VKSVKKEAPYRASFSCCMMDRYILIRGPLAGGSSVLEGGLKKPDCARTRVLKRPLWPWFRFCPFVSGGDSVRR